MESAAVLRSFHYSMGTALPLRSASERLGVVSMYNSSFGCDLISSQKKRTGALVSCVKSSEVSVVEKSNGECFLLSESSTLLVKIKHHLNAFIFCYDTYDHHLWHFHLKDLWRKNFQQFQLFLMALSSHDICGSVNIPPELVLGVCDETQIAELKMKIGGFELHLKRNIKSAEAIIPVASPTEAPPIPSKPMTESSPATPPSPPTSQKVTPFTNIPVEKSKKLAALEASGASGYVLVSCPTVGTFRKGRTLKGKKQPTLIKEGDVIKEGQTICYLDQFGTELPVKSDAAGEVIKILFDDGEAVGYGDPLIAVSQ
ncbi:hypothetical protein SSX86_003740 [Deinandra increscens subsp. villosa]|uniref:Lipoyl-binding domain-containing protein n=1 Tax=Deinandra increscens subsp. villosa TaxID=3103831 RepID=A0AAP0H8C6_9ASTR